MPTTILRVGWAAGRFDSDANEVAGYLAANIRRYRLDLVGTDESQQLGLQGIVAELVASTHAVWKRGEYMAIYRRSALARRARSRMWHLSAVAGLIGWRQMRAAVFPLRITATGSPMRLPLSHTPAHVEMGEHWRDDTRSARKQVRASKRGHHRLGLRLRRAARRNPNLFQLVLEDANTDQLLAVWRHWVSLELGGHSIWAGRLPGRGSHGDRLIDTGTVVAGANVHYEVLEAHVSDIPKPPGYDHDLIWFTIRITI